MITDGTVLRLHRFLSEEFEPRRGVQGGARLHLLHSVTGQTIDRFSVTYEKAHDSTEFSTGSWLEDRLVLFDQAYFKYRRFALIDENDGYLLSRLKPTSNPETTADYGNGVWVISATDEHSDSVSSVMDGSRRFEIVEHLSNAELD